MFCSKCGKQVEKDDIYCKNCGNKLSDNESKAQDDSIDQTCKKEFVNIEERKINTAPAKKINPHLYLISVWGGILFLIAGGIMANDYNDVPRTILFFLGVAGLIFGFVYSLVCIYKCWKILQGFTARTTAGKAVGYIFIPFYNIYWIFVALKGLADDANDFFEQRHLDKKISEGLSVAAGIFFVIPYGLILVPIFISILIYQWANFYNTAISNWDALSKMPVAETKRRQEGGNLAVIIIAALIGLIIIIGILATIAIPQFVQYRTKGYCATTKSNLQNAYSAFQSYSGSNPNKSITDIDELTNYGFKKADEVSIRILNMTNDNLSMEASHPQCDKLYYIDSRGNISEEKKPSQ
ncbi:MAG TPA: zinc-ribbon domain-containing protein [Smithella sp.]|nr:zinc-ribbon domain-containing protein [Smithella sp.]